MNDFNFSSAVVPPSPVRLPTRERLTTFALIYYPVDDRDVACFGEYLKTLGYPCYISPLHTPDDNDLKPHYHLLFNLGSLRKERNTLNKLFHDTFSNCTLVQPVTSFIAYARYLCHLDNPEKQQDFPRDPLQLNDIDSWDEVITRNSDAFSVVDVLECINTYGISSLSMLISHFASSPEALRFITSHSYLCKSLLNEHLL